MTVVEGLANFRDTGGLPLIGRGTSRFGVLFRSDALVGMTSRGLDELAATDIGVVVDFRTPAERRMAPDQLPTTRPFRTIQLSILQGAVADAVQSAADSATAGEPPRAADALVVPALGDMYVDMLAAGGASFVEVARLIAHSHADSLSAVLVHCTAGKDRTGVSVAVILDAAGVEREAIIADYASSESNLAGAWSEQILALITQHGIPLTPQLRTLATGTPPEAIEQALDWLDAQFGGGSGYLRDAGLTDRELGMLRSRMRG